ncbi:DUF6314 family protein [Arthrobacter monumenti]
MDCSEDLKTDSGVADLKAFLLGTWRIERRLLDRASGNCGTFTGTAVFHNDGAGGLTHDEAGTLVWPGQAAAPTTRRLILRPTGSPSALDVFFDDGRPFHRLDLATGTDHPAHPCSPDIYRGSFLVADADSWSYAWSVTGPAKDLLLTSDLRRDVDPKQTGAE